MVLNFLGAMENPFRSHKLWREATEEEHLETMDCLETYILRDPRIYRSIIGNMHPEWRDKDAHLERRLFCLQFLRPAHLDVKRAHGLHPALLLARRSLRRFSAVRSPREKVECVFCAAEVIFKMLNETSKPGHAASADEFLPILILCVLYARPKRVYTAVEFITLFRNPRFLSGERQYFLVQLLTAVTFLDNLTPDGVSMDANEFNRCLRAREELWDRRLAEQVQQEELAKVQEGGRRSETAQARASELARLRQAPALARTLTATTSATTGALRGASGAGETRAETPRAETPRPSASHQAQAWPAGYS